MSHRPSHIDPFQSAQHRRKKQRQRFPFGGGGDDRFDFLNDIFFGAGNEPTFRGGAGGRRFSRGLQAFGGSTRRGFQRQNLGELERLGFSPSPNTSFNPFAGTLGGVRSVAGVSGLRPETDAMGAPGSLAGYRHDIISDLFKRRRITGGGAGAAMSRSRARDAAKGGRGGFSTGNIVGTRTGDFGGGDLDPIDDDVVDNGFDPFSPNRITSRDRGGNRATGGDDLFAGLDPLSRAIRLGGQEAQLSSIGQFRALANLGIFGPGGIQSILEQAEGPEQAILEDLPGREAEFLGQSRADAANQRRRQQRGLGGQLGRTGVQRPGVAAAISAGAAVPVNIAEQDRAFGIQQQFQNLEDQINLGQGQRRAGLLEANMRSKAGGVAGLAGQAGQVAGILGSQFLDPTNPLQNQLNFQTNIMDQQFQNQMGINSYQQIYQQQNMQYQGYLNRLQQTQGANIQLWLEQMFKDLGLGQYSQEIQSYIDAFMPDSFAIG